MKAQQEKILKQNIAKLVTNLQENKFNVVESDKVPISNFCHMAIKMLVDRNLVRGVVTENTDHMHVKSGID